jgi:hypothetical protein
MICGRSVLIDYGASMHGYSISPTHRGARHAAVFLKPTEGRTAVMGQVFIQGCFNVSKKVSSQRHKSQGHLYQEEGL